MFNLFLSFYNMKSCIFLCIVYVVTYTEEHLVVLSQNDKAPTLEKLSHSSDGEATENLAENASDDKGSEEAQSSSSEVETLQGAENELQEDSNSSSQSESDTSSPKKVVMHIPKGQPEKYFESDKERKLSNWMKWASEVAAGNPLDIIGANPHTYQPDSYVDLNRRFVLQYPYTDTAAVPQVDQNIEAAPGNKDIVPIEAPQQLVELVAKESVKRVAAKPFDPSADVIGKKLLRSGDFWNGVWKEDINPKAALRSSSNDLSSLGVIKAKIMPGNEFYEVIANMKKISPRLLYIINEKSDDQDFRDN